MKRLVFLVAALLCLGGFSPSFNEALFSGGSSLQCSQANAFIARTSGFDAKHTNAYKNLICGLVLDGVFSTLDELQVYATSDSTTAAINLISSSFGGTNNGAIFSANNGFTTDGVATYFDMGLVPSTAGGNATQNSTSFSYWSLSIGQQANVSGANDNTRSTILNPRNASDIIRGDVNTGTSSVNFGSNTDGTGFYTLSRTGANLQTSYKNGAFVATDVSASFGLPTSSFNLGRNNNVSPVFTARQFAASAVGGGRNATQETALYNRLRTYMTAVGVP